MKLFPEGQIVSTKTGKALKLHRTGNNQSVNLFNGEKNIGVTISKLLDTYFGIKKSENNVVVSLDGEYWKPIPSFENLYMISSHGRVKAIKVPYFGERLLKYTEQKRGQLAISLSKKNRKTSIVVSNLMGKVFLPNPNNFKMVIHLDGNKTNNHISNIIWVHNSEAQQLAVRLGLKPILFGEENPTSVSVCQYSSDGMTLIKRWGCITDVERELGIPHSNISKVCRGKRNTAGGYYWEYEV